MYNFTVSVKSNLKIENGVRSFETTLLGSEFGFMTLTIWRNILNEDPPLSSGVATPGPGGPVPGYQKFYKFLALL